MATPTPVFPAAVATDANLKIANNLIKTSLKVSAGASDTILWVNSITGLVPNCLVSIDKEIIAISAIGGGSNPSLTVDTGGRGFDGTTAAQHAAGAQVAMFIDAWHHNALSTEVKAIEAALGPNLSNVGKSPFLISTDYVFSPESPGGVLNPGANVITIAPVPKGVNGSDTNHFLYISGGTGAAENVLITGGTAVSGAASGTLIFNCANGHTGAWTIQSATAGIREAIIAAPAQSKIVIPAGTYLIDCLVIDKMVWLQGSAEMVSTLKPRLGTYTNASSASVPETTLISVYPKDFQWPVRVSDLSIVLDGFSIEGLRVDFVTRGKFNNLRIEGGTYGIRLGITNQVAWCHFFDISILHPSNTGFWVNGDDSTSSPAGPGAACNWYDDIDIQQDSASPMQCGFAIIRTLSRSDSGNQYMKRIQVTRVSSGTLTNGFLFTSTLTNAIFNIEMLDCIADAITGDALKMINCAEIKSTLGWFASSGADSTGAAISFNGGFHFSFFMTKIISGNASAFTYANSPSNITMVRNIYGTVAQFVHNLPATGGPIGLQFIEEILQNLTDYTNDFSLLQAAQAGIINPTSSIDFIGGNLRLFDLSGSNYVLMQSRGGNLSAYSTSLAPMFTSTAGGDFIVPSSVFVKGATKVSAGTGNPNGIVIGSPGDLYLNQSGGANATLWVKETTVGTAGWVAK